MVNHMVDGHNPLTQLLGHDVTYLRHVGIAIKRHMNFNVGQIIKE